MRVKVHVVICQRQANLKRGIPPKHELPHLVFDRVRPQICTEALIKRWCWFILYCAVQKNSVPAAAGAVATSRTVFLLNIVLKIV